MMAKALTVLTGGHPFEDAPFADLLASLEGWSVTHLRHPEAEAAVAAGALDDADAVLFYDMPGYTFADGRVSTCPPSVAFRAALRRRFAGGRGAVAMHHALAGWAEWPEWSEWLGGRFLYQSGAVRGEDRLDSGYRHDVAYTARVVADHPVTAGLPKTFELCDELYLAEVFEREVEPLLRADHAFVSEGFYSAAHAVGGRMFSNAGWDHPPGANLIGWISRALAAPLVYLQPGDGPAAYQNPQLRRLLANALDFVASPASRGG